MTINDWREEYNKKGIPSSFRTEPSASVVHFFQFLKKVGEVKGAALDLGCGKGRNAFYMAKNGYDVTAVDFVPEVIEEINARAKSEGLPVTGICQSVTEHLPFPDKTFDIIIDVFCYKHIVDKEQQEDYRRELVRVLDDEGLYMISLAGDDDGFYGPLLHDSPDPEHKVIIDPVTKVASNLYSREDLEKAFAPDLVTVDFLKKTNLDFMHGKEYLRSTLICIMKKNLEK